MTAPTDSPDLAAASVTWLTALLDSANVEIIGVSHWWPRATTALATAAETSESYGHAVDLAAGKLQINVLTAASARALAALEPVIGPRLAEWRTIARTEAVYIVALCRIARKARAAGKTPAPPPPYDEPEF